MRQKIEVNIGDRTGKLEIIEKLNNKDYGITGQLFNARCDCGNITRIRACDYKSGHKKSCGCSIKTRGKPEPFNKNKYIGKKFHQLQIIDYIGTDRTSTKVLFHLFKYQCDCGKIGEISTSKIGRNISCGCALRKGCGEMNGSYFGKIKEHSVKRGIEFHITKEFLWDLFLKQNRKCALTGVELSFQSKSLVFDGTASLDRIDSSKHYTEDNVQWVHKTVNNIKQSLTEKELFDWASLIVEHNKGRF